MNNSWLLSCLRHQRLTRCHFNGARFVQLIPSHKSAPIKVVLMEETPCLTLLLLYYRYSRSDIKIFRASPSMSEAGGSSKNIKNGIASSVHFYGQKRLPFAHHCLHPTADGPVDIIIRKLRYKRNADQSAAGFTEGG